MRKHHRAGAAVALAATLLGPRRARLLAQPIEQRRPRRKTVERAGFTAKAEGKVSSGIRRGWARNHLGPRLVGQSYHDPGSHAPFNTREAHWRKFSKSAPEFPDWPDRPDESRRGVIPSGYRLDRQGRFRSTLRGKELCFHAPWRSSATPILPPG